MVKPIGLGHICISTMLQQNQLTEEEKKQKVESLYNKFIQNLPDIDNKYTTGIYREDQGLLNTYVIKILSEESETIIKMTVKTELNNKIEVLNEFVQNLEEKIKFIEIYKEDQKHKYRFEIKTERFEPMVKMRVNEFTHERAKHGNIKTLYEKMK